MYSSSSSESESNASESDDEEEEESEEEESQSESDTESEEETESESEEEKEEDNNRVIVSDLDVEHERQKELMMTEVVEKQQGESAMFEISQPCSPNAIYRDYYIFKSLMLLIPYREWASEQHGIENEWIKTISGS